MFVLQTICIAFYTPHLNDTKIANLIAILMHGLLFVSWSAHYEHLKSLFSIKARYHYMCWLFTHPTIAVYLSVLAAKN